MTTAKEVSRAAYLCGLSALRALPSGFVQSLEQSRRFDDRLTQIDTDFADHGTTSDVADAVFFEGLVAAAD